MTNWEAKPKNRIRFTKYKLVQKKRKVLVCRTARKGERSGRDEARVAVFPQSPSAGKLEVNVAPLEIENSDRFSLLRDVGRYFKRGYMGVLHGHSAKYMGY